MAVQQQQSSSAGTRRKTTKSNYNIIGVFIVLLAIGAFVLGNMAVDSAKSFKEEMQALEAKRATAIKNKEDYANQIQSLQGIMQTTQQKEATWKESDKKLTKPYAIGALAWMEAKAKDQKPQLTATNTNSDDSKKPGTVTMQVSGDFKSLLNWIMESEHELDLIRIVKATWKARSSQTVELTLNIEVDNNE